MLVLYPVMHETGHILAAWATGGTVSRIGVFPFPSVTLSLSGGTEARALFVAACGGWFPLAVLLLPGSGLFYLYCVKGTTALMGLCCGVESAVRGIMFLYAGQECAANDAVIMLRMYPGSKEVVFLTLAVQIAASAAYLLKTAPPDRIARYWTGE